ncbi:unnamed protein product [Lampetra planeri]
MMAHLPGSIAVHPMSPGHSLKDRGTSARRPTAITGELSSNSDQPTSAAAAAAETLPSGGQSPAGGSKGEGSMSKSGMEPQLSSLLAPIQDGLLDMVHDFRVNGLKPLVLGSQVKEGGTRRKRGPSLMTRLKTMAGHEGGQHEECPGQQLSRKGGHPPREGGNRTQHTLTAHLHACLQNLGKHYRSVAVPTTPHTRCCHFVVEEGEAAALAFCHHAGYAIVGAHCQRLQELSKRRARLLFSRDYVQALTSASLYVRHVSGLLSADRDLLCDLRGRCHSGSIATSQHQLPPLKSTCSELQDLCKSWSGLYQRVRSGPAFGENAWTHGAHLPGVAQSSTRDLRTQQRSCFNRSSLPLLALQGVSCMEQLLCIRLCLLARHPDLVPKSDICQAIVMFNKTLAEFQTSDCAKCCIYPKIDACAFPSGLAVKVVSMQKVLKIVANERAVSVAHTLCSAFSPDQEWDVSLGKVANADDDFLAQIGLLPGSDVPVGSTDEGLTPGQAPPKDKLKDKTASIVCILRQLCSAEDGFMKTILAVCLSNVSLPEENAVLQQETCIVGQSYLSHRLSDYIEQGSERCLAERLRVDGETPRIPGPPAAMFSETTSWARWYQRRLWRGVSTRLLGRLFLPTHACDGGAHRGLGPLGFHPYPVVMALVEDLRKAGAQECLPLECQQQVRAASSHLHAWLVMRSWDAVFCQALSSASRDRCAPCADEGACMTTTARLFHQSLLPLQSLLASCHGTTLLPSANSPIARCAMEQGLATLQAAFHWLSTKSFHFLASWSLEEVFLVTQGDLRVFLEASSAFLLLAKAASVSAGSDGRQRDARSALTLLENTALQLQALSEETLRLFASDCKKMAQETLEQTMPLGKQWRLAKELAARPTEPNEYALVAVATVVQPVMEALAPLETHCQAEPAAQVCSALMLAWMEHIVHKKVVFSVQGGLQLKMDFQALRSYVASESCPLAPETRRRVLGLSVFRHAEEAARCLLKQPRRPPNLLERGRGQLSSLCSRGSEVSSYHSLESLDFPCISSKVLPVGEPQDPGESVESVKPFPPAPPRQGKAHDYGTSNATAPGGEGEKCFPSASVDTERCRPVADRRDDDGGGTAKARGHATSDAGPPDGNRVSVTEEGIVPDRTTSPLPGETDVFRQEVWLALRLHGGVRRWRFPQLPCLTREPEQ